ncbi:MAG TPA: hypothetical protein PLG75_07830 [Methanoculleus sp.]|nr:hypothetical protein [Methanoculleus sp.]
MRRTIERRISALEQAPRRRSRGVSDMTDEELLHVLDDEIIETPRGPVPFKEADEATRWHYIEAVARGATL